MLVYFGGFLKEQFIFYELFCEGPSALRKFALTAMSGLNIGGLVLLFDVKLKCAIMAVFLIVT